MYTPRRLRSSIFRLIFNVYGRAALLTARKWERLAHRIADNYRKIAFLHVCIREDLPPRSLRRKPIVDSFEGRRVVRQFQHGMMRALIGDLHRRTGGFIRCAQDHRELCRTRFTDQHFAALNHHVQLVFNNTRLRATNRLQDKIEGLRELRKNTVPSENLVHNLSSKTLTHSQLSLLQRDVGHNLTDARALDFMAALEPTLHRVGMKEVGDDIRHRVVGLLMSHRPHQALSRNELEALAQLKKDDATLILPADKGRATVVMDRAHYISKASGLLEDTTAYRIVSGDPMVTLKNRVNKTLNALKRGRRLDDVTLLRIRPSDTAAARFYGLPKVHKEGVPLRPIVSFRGTPTSGLAKWLSLRISHLVADSQTVVRSAEEFLDKVRSLRIEDDEVMVSFDVVSLFTSIPQDLALATVKDLLSRRGLGQHQDSLRPEDLVDLLGLCLKTYFTFQGNTYEQIKGTPMGSPISSVIAEAVLQWIEQVAMAQYCPKFWARYVDDTFVVIKKSRKADFVGVLNSVCVDLQFTEEEEHQGRLAFLDVLVHRQPDGTLATRVYRKPTHTDRILHFNSNHPVSHKVSCIRTLFKRADSHCSTAKAKAEERKYLFHTCRRNGYPNKFIRRHSALPRPPHNPPIGELLPQTTRITLPYVSNVSEATARLLSPYGIRVAHRPDRTLRSCIMRLKDPLPVTEKSGVIYRICCMDCPGNYVGETSKRVRTRIQEHKLAIKRGEHYSQIFTHMAELGHKFDFNGVQVVASDASKSGRLLKEAWFSDCKSINRCVELHPAHQVMKAWEARIGSRRRRHPIVCNPDCSNKETDNEMRAILPSRVPPAISGSCAHLLMNEESLDNSNPPPGILDAPNTSPLPPPPPRYGVRPIERYRALLPPTLEVKQNSPPHGDFDACVPDDPFVISDLDACLKIGTPGVDDDYNRTTKGPITRSRTAWWTREGARAKTAVGISSEGRVESDAKLTGTEIATNCCTSHACKGGGLGAIGEDGSTNEVVCPRRVMRQTRGREVVGSRISSQDRSAVTQVTLVRSDMEYSHPSPGAARNREVISCRNLELRNTSDVSDGRINRPGPITRSMSRVQARLGL